MASFDGWIVAGLGNPGSRYVGTRHDLGFALADRLATQGGAAWRSGRDADVAGPMRFGGGAPALLVKPMRFMNLSGPPILALLEREGVPPGRLLVACDDINLPLGMLRLRPGGSAGGHNGLASLIACLGGDFARLRMGVGREPEGTDRAEWVLGHFGAGEAPAVQDLLERACAAVRSVLERGVEASARGLPG